MHPPLPKPEGPEVTDLDRIVETSARGVVQAKALLDEAAKQDLPVWVRGRIAEDLELFVTIYSALVFPWPVDLEQAIQSAERLHTVLTLAATDHASDLPPF